MTFTSLTGCLEASILTDVRFSGFGEKSIREIGFLMNDGREVARGGGKSRWMWVVVRKAVGG